MRQLELMLAWVLALFLSLTLPGCTLAMLHQIDKGSTLTPEQIEAYKQQNLDVWGCFTIAGPPPTGASTWIILPKGSGGPTFLDGCRIK